MSQKRGKRSTPSPQRHPDSLENKKKHVEEEDESVATSPTYSLNSGYKIPSIGFGTMQIPNDKLVETLRHALDIGYRLFDGAEVYGNEKEIGEALKTIFAEGKYKREDLFYTSKVFNHHHRPEAVAAACRNTLKNLQFTYLDLYLVHWPFALGNDDPRAKNEKGKAILDKVPLSQTWKAMEQLVKEKLVRSIGVSNFPVVILNDLLSYAEIPPATNQIEIHPFNQRTALVDFCHDNNIHCTSYFPAARYGTQQDAPHKNPKPFPSVLTNTVLLGLAKKYNKTPSQICLRWNIQRKVKEAGKFTAEHYKVSIIPRSSNPVHIKENFDILDFQLTDEELEAVAGLEEGYALTDVTVLFGFPVWS